MRLKLILFGLFVSAALPAHAIDFIATNIYVVGPQSVISEEQWVCTEMAETEGVFQDDLFILSGNPLHLNGTFEGNVWGLTALDANLSGTCLRNVRLTGKTVRIDGPINGNLIAMAETIIIGTNATIGGSVRLLGSSIIHEGLIEGDAVLSSARIVTLDGIIQGQAKVTCPDILLSRDTRIQGDFSYLANKELFPADGVVGGTLKRIRPIPAPLFSMNRLTSRVLWLLAAFFAGVPFIALFPMTTAMAAQLVRQSPWKCLLAGFLASLALPMVGIMCVSSLIGIPLGALILAAWGTMFYLSRIIMGLVLGTLILRSAGRSIGRILAAMALGLAIIYSATIIPSIGIPVQAVVLWLGMGSLILALLEKRRLIIQVPHSLKQLEQLKNEKNTNQEDTP